MIDPLLLLFTTALVRAFEQQRALLLKLTE